MKDLTTLEKDLKVQFKDKALLKQALVHRSYINEHPDFQLGHNERLEFLGDAVFEIIVTRYLYHKYPQTPEGDLTDWRASLVNAKMLAQVAKDIGLEDYLLMSRGEAKDANTKARMYILANAMEAFLGALYLDQGEATCSEFVATHLLWRLDGILKNETYIDPKSKFQEKAQETYNITPTYKVIAESGPDHDKTFEVGLYLQQELIAKGSGSSKQEAQVEAASAGLAVKNWN